MCTANLYAYALYETKHTSLCISLQIIFSATIGAFSLGTVLGWSSPATPFLVDCNEVDGNYSDTLQNCTLPKSFSAEEGSWISSTVNFGMLFGAIMAGRKDVNFS